MLCSSWGRGTCPLRHKAEMAVMPLTGLPGTVGSMAPAKPSKCQTSRPGVPNTPRQGVVSAILVSDSCVFQSPSASLDFKRIQTPAWLARLFPTVPQPISPATPMSTPSASLTLVPQTPHCTPLSFPAAPFFPSVVLPQPSLHPENPFKYPASEKSLPSALVHSIGHTEL